MKTRAPARPSMLIQPGPLRGGEVRPPGDKSISHRVAMLSALAAGASRVRNFLTCEDCLNTLHAMEALGARTVFAESGELTVHGTGGKVIEPASALDLGNSGTGMRLLAGLAAGWPITVEMTGDESLRSRPMKRIKEPLERMGARIELLGPNGCAPIRVRGGNLKGIEYPLPVASAQVKSCALLAGLFATGRTTVIEPAPTRDHTERLFTALGIRLRVDGPRIELDGYGAAGPALTAREFDIPGDFSSAAFWLAAGAMSGPEVTITVRQVGLNPRRTALLDVLRRMGARITVRAAAPPPGSEPVGDVTVSGGGLQATEIGGAEIPNLIDEIPIIAALAARAEGETIIRNAAELRVKESDRIATMVGNLQLLGVDARELADGLAVRGPARLKGAGNVRSFGDHRIAMAMAVLGAFAAEPVCVNNIACIETSYPGFWEHFRSLGGHVE